MLADQHVVLRPDTTYPLFITAKRYTHPASLDAGSRRSAVVASASAPPLTLLLLHSTSFHKEIFEPVLRYLWARMAQGEIRVREAWAVECPNHGESAVLNGELLQRVPYKTYCES
jgi:hypothetical protein